MALRADSARCEISAFKPAENGSGTVLRIFNPTDTDEMVNIYTDNAVTAAYLARTDEKRISDNLLKDGVIKLTAAAKKIITIELT